MVDSPGRLCGIANDVADCFTDLCDWRMAVSAEYGWLLSVLMKR